MPDLLLADFGLFGGRFHPLVVHLPAGFLFLAVPLEGWPGEKVRSAVRITRVLATGSSNTLFRHRWRAGGSVTALTTYRVGMTGEEGGKAKAYSVLSALLPAVTGLSFKTPTIQNNTK